MGIDPYKMVQKKHMIKGLGLLQNSLVPPTILSRFVLSAIQLGEMPLVFSAE